MQTLEPAMRWAPAEQVADPVVWDRLWRHRPTEAKDASLLDRERRSTRWALVVDRLEATFGSLRGLRTIELGCGRGDLSTLLAQRGARVTLFDRSTAALREARWRFDRLGLDANYVEGDMLGTLEGVRGNFDVAVSMGVVEHFAGKARSAVMRAHHDVLKNRGVAVVSVPHARCLPYRVWKAYLELRGWWPYGFERPYTHREIGRRARDVGFARSETHGLCFLQSVGDQWIKRLTGRAPGWVDRRCSLDSLMGLVLLMFAWRGR